MAVTFSTNAAASPITSTAIVRSFTVGGTNPVLVVGVGVEALSPTAVTSVTWSLGGGTAVAVTSVRCNNIGTGSYGAIWAIPAPTAGAGSVKVGLNSSVPIQMNVAMYLGADQTTPCPAGDAVCNTSASDVDDVTVTANNLTANDIDYGLGVLTQSGSPISVGPIQMYLDSTTNVNYEDGYATGTTGVRIQFSGGVNLVRIAARVQQATAGGGVSQPPFEAGSNLDGMGSPGIFFKGME